MIWRTILESLLIVAGGVLAWASVSWATYQDPIPAFSGETRLAGDTGIGLGALLCVVGAAVLFGRR